MLWIECHDGSLINMAHVKKIDTQYFHETTIDEPAGLWLVVYLVGENEPIKVAHGNTEKACQTMKYRIQTYFGLDENYVDRHVIRYKWLTHELP